MRTFCIIFTLGVASMLLGPREVLASDKEELKEQVERMKNIKDNVELRLVRKGWLPDGVNIPTDGPVLDEYPHNEAMAVLWSDCEFEYNIRLLNTAMELFTDKEFGYNPKLDSIVVINPPSANGERFEEFVVKALAMRNFLNHYNVFTLDFILISKVMAKVTFKSVFGRNPKYDDFAKAVGSVFDEAIKANLLRTDQINFIGFCYASQLAGYIGRYIKVKNNGQKIGSILGLDPFSAILSVLSHTSLSAGDAQVVHIFHTNSAFIGTFLRRGTADFIFNGGNIQPGCFKNINMFCSHEKSIMYGLFVILYKSKFQARTCWNHVLFNICLCEGKQTVTLSYPLENNVRGKFYLKADENNPYGLGEKGTKCLGR